MTIPLRRLEAAASWDQAVCLECETLLDPGECEVVDEGTLCPTCGTASVFSAEFILRVWRLVEEAE